MKIPTGWQSHLGGETSERYFHELLAFVESERATRKVFPPEEDVFRAFELTPLDAVKVVLLGQDPYHDDGQAHGLCFSVRPPTRPPPSLKNIFRELSDDLGIEPPGAEHGSSTPAVQTSTFSAISSASSISAPR